MKVLYQRATFFFLNIGLRGLYSEVKIPNMLPVMIHLTHVHAKFAPNQNRHIQIHVHIIAGYREWRNRPKKILCRWLGSNPRPCAPLVRATLLACVSPASPAPWCSCWVVGLELDDADAILLAGVDSGPPSSSIPPKQHRPTAWLTALRYQCPVHTLKNHFTISYQKLCTTKLSLPNLTRI